jgi:DNA-binding transcriptional LysR family regulator
MKALDTVRIFVSTVQRGSLTAAARALGLSPATVSRRINSLEQELGMRLIDRNSRELKPTEAGLLFYARMENVLEDVATTENLVRNIKQVPEGRLRVHSRTLLGIRLIAPLLRRFSARYPDLTVDLHLSETPVNLIEQNYDVDLRLGPLEDSSYVVRKLAAGDRIAVASPTYVSTHRPVQVPTDLEKGHNCLTYRRASEPTSWRYMEGDREKVLAVQGSVHSNNGEVLRLAAVSGVGVALLADWAVADDLHAGRLVHLLQGYRLTNTTFDNGVYALFRDSRMQPLKVRVFIDFLAEALSRIETRHERDADRPQA